MFQITHLKKHSEELSKGLGQFADLRGGLAKKRECFFEGGGVDTPMHTMTTLLYIPVEATIVFF